MPFNGKKLPPEAIDEFAEWIRAGVPYGETAEEADAAFARCRQALGVPQTCETAGAQGRAGANPVDPFLCRALRRQRPRATGRSRQTHTHPLLVSRPRRVAAVAEAVAALVADKNSKAWEALIDRLLASRPYGEQRGRHWLDIWRYADLYGYRKSGQVRYSQRYT